MWPSPYQSLGLPETPIFLAPLAGVSDHPFRRVCTRWGASLTYVEMLSATALTYKNARTLQMAKRHDTEQLLGVQVTGSAPETLGEAVAILDAMPFDTIDLNMGCPVAKIVSAGCGSASLKDPAHAQKLIGAARAATRKPLSVKIRLGWDHRDRQGLEVALAAEAAGADWVTVHGRLRADDYATPVDLDGIARIKERLRIPVVGNGNLFSGDDVRTMRARSVVDGVMVSRGALGNPWVFRELTTGDARVTLDEWREGVLTHLSYQQEEYGDQSHGAVMMRKHLLWYVKGWPGAKRLREELAHVSVVSQAAGLIEAFAEDLAQRGFTERLPIAQEAGPARFSWDPKWEMDRRLDRGIGHEGLPS